MKLICYKKRTFQNKVDVLNIDETFKKEFYKPETKNSHSISLQQSESKKLELPKPKMQEAAIDYDHIEVVGEVNDVPAIFSAKEEKMFEHKEAERNKAQIAAAERSMKTNLLASLPKYYGCRLFY